MDTPDTPRKSRLEHSLVFKQMFDSLEQGVALFGADRTLLYVNKEMTSVTGGGEKSIGDSLENLARRHGLRTEAGAPIEHADFPINHAFAGHETRDKTYMYVDPAGANYWLRVSCVRILDDAGKLQYVLNTIRDVTSRKTREDKLHILIESAKILSLETNFKERLRQKAMLTVPSLADWCAIDIVKDGGLERVAVVHRDRAMVDYVAEFEKRFPPDQNNPNGIPNLIKECRPLFVPVIPDEMIQKAARSPEHYAGIQKLHLHSIMVLPIVARGRALGAMTVAYAESGRTYTEDDFKFFQEFCQHLGVVLDNGRLYHEISKQDKAKDLFLASLSHELRNPLAPIKSSLELLKFRDLSADVREEIGAIEHQFDHMAKLLNDLLDTTRFTHAKIELSPQRIELRKLVERALKSADALLRNADITLHYAFPSQQIELDADETRLEQAINNLMSNAVKFTPAGGAIWVDVAKDGDEALIKVRDTGAGIDPKDLPNIFEMYYQSERSKQANSGLGIGLLLVKKTIELHGGTVEAQSAGVGSGSEFTIRLPLTSELPPVTTENEPRRPEEVIAGKRVLVVDDNVQAADSLVRLLGKLGAHAEACYSGEDTLAHPGLASFNIILLDIGMPGIDGYEVIKRMRAADIRVPAVALTGYGLIDDKQKASAAGFDAHLTKPIGIKELDILFRSIFPD